MKLETRGITKSFDGTRIIEDISITLGEGELVCLLGVSGGGKTTLFNIIAGLSKPDSGQVLIDGEDVTGKPGHVSYMLQKDLLLPFRKVADNVALPLELALHPAEQERFREIQGVLAEMGFELETAQGALLARSIPPSLNRAEARDFLREALAGRKDDLAAMFISLSCKGAIKAGQRLTLDEAAGLLRQWLETPEREYCPHGRPAVLRWDAGALERLFKRRQ